jgi:flagellar basal-body rod protein FlgF
MSDGIYLALSGAVGETEKLDVVATNLSNAATVGYQRIRPVFHQALAAAQSAAGGVTATTELDTSRGATRVTGRALDVTLPSSTYLALSTPRGERYSRAGALSVSTEGTLQTRTGEAVVSENGRPIQIARDKGDPSITPEGDVLQDGEAVGHLKLVTFAVPAQLAPEGNALLAETAASGPSTVATGQLHVGSLEESNTSVVAR